MTVCVFGLTNPSCTSINALSSGVNFVRNIAREHDALYKLLVSLGRYPQFKFKAFNKEEAEMYLVRSLTLDADLV